MQTWKLTLEYDGTRYSGWQEQPNSRTVQGELYKAAQDLFRCDLELGGAGRTDAGVHAMGQVAHLKILGRTKLKLDPTQIFYGLNDRLPADINLLEIAAAAPRFHARHDAVARNYLYQISTRRTAFAKKYVWWVRDRLNVKAMTRAAETIKGRHDFAAFCERDPKRDASTIVVVDTAEITTEDHLIFFRIAASHFLWKMVRRLVGSIAEVGRGKVKAEEFAALIAEPRRKSPLDPARVTAPPSGLFLEKVVYPDDPRK
jgi:tRNA pseudouridine38-40 synthase